MNKRRSGGKFAEAPHRFDAIVGRVAETLCYGFINFRVTQSKIRRSMIAQRFESWLKLYLYR